MGRKNGLSIQWIVGYDIGMEPEYPEDTTGLPHGGLQPIPVPPEVVEEAIRTFDEKEVMEAIQEIRRGAGRKFEEFINELEGYAKSIPTRRPLESQPHLTTGRIQISAI